MPASLKRTWIALVMAMLAVVGSGALIAQRFANHVAVECRGKLVALGPNELAELGDPGRYHPVDGRSDVTIQYDINRTPNVGNGTRPRPAANAWPYTNVRVVWSHANGQRSCSDVPVDWDGSYSPTTLLIEQHDAAENLFFVRRASDTQSTLPRGRFRKVDVRSMRVQWDHLLDGHNASMAVLLVAIAALAVATFRALRAVPYATRIHAWKTAVLRDDGLVESDNCALLGMMETRARVPPGEVLVDPSAFEGRDVYRALPILTRRSVRVGTHERWCAGTMRHLRDARSLAVLSTMTTGLALLARLVGG